MELPLGQPLTLLPDSRLKTGTCIGSSGAATLSSLPRGLRPPMVLEIVAECGAVARTRSAPPRCCSPSAASVLAVSM